MFKSATIKLTAWYIVILMLISIVFSIIIYNLTSCEIEMRLENFQMVFEKPLDTTYPNPIMTDYRSDEIANSKLNLAAQLFLINFVIITIGGFGSYLLARRNVLPIEKAHEAQSRFTSDASHEFRTPLAVMKTEIEVALQDKNATAKDLRNILSSNIEEIDKLSKLAGMLLSLSHLDNAKLEFSSVDMHDLLSNIIKKYNKQSDHIILNSGKNIVVTCNEIAIINLANILIDNALKYSPRDSQIAMNLSKNDKFAIFTITNSGHGIPSDKLTCIFDRFYRVDSSRTNNGQNSYGLGLSLAKDIINLHNGNISVTSELNHETTFTVSLPLNNIQTTDKN